MANITKKVINKEYRDKLKTIKEFSEDHGKGISSQAVDYAIANDHIDYIVVGPRIKVVVLTGKTLAYTPNKSTKREKAFQA